MTRLEAGVGLVVDVRDELAVGVVRNICLPMMSCAGETDASEEEHGENDGSGQGR